MLVTGSEGYIGSLLGPYLVERGHEVLGVDTGFYSDGWLYNAADDGPDAEQGHPGVHGAGTSRGSTQWCIWPNSRTTRSGSSRRGHVRDQPRAARMHVAATARPPASRGSSIRRRAASTARPRRSSSTRSRRCARRRRTPNASSSSNGTSRPSAEDASRRPSCAMRPHTEPRRGCASTSSSTTSAGWPGRPGRSGWRATERRGARSSTCSTSAGHRLRARGAARACPRADPQRRRPASELPDPRDRRDRRRRLPGLRGDRRRPRARRTQLPRFVRQDPRGAARVRLRVGSPSAARANCSSVLAAST